MRRYGLQVQVVGVLWLSAMLSLGVCPAEAAGRKAAYPERLVYDPVTGKWQEVASPRPGTESGELELALRELAEGQPASARKRLKKWLKRYPNSPRRADAMLALADAELALGNRMRAYNLYEKVLEEFPGRESDERILKREFAIATAFLAGVKQKFLGIPMFPAYDEALDILDRIALRVPASPLAAEAIKAKADYYYRTGQFYLAETEYARLAQEFPRGRYYRQALLMAARSALARFPGLNFDESALLEARERFETLRREFPDFAAQEGVDALIRQIDETLARKQVAIARWYLKQGRKRSAAFYCRDTIRRWPGTAAAGEARKILSQLGVKLAAQPAEPPSAGANAAKR